MSQSAAVHPADHRPTGVRHLVVLMALLMSLLLYLDRFCISFAGPLIKEDLGLTNAQMGWIFFAFFWSYALGQVPSGWFSDRFGPRMTLTLYILAWSLFTALSGLAAGFWLLVTLRLGFGLAQAGAYPTAGGLLRAWVPFSSRGLASSLVASGGRIGGVFAPVLTAYLIVLFVPVQTPSRFHEADLLDFPHFCHLLQQPDANKNFSDVSRTLVDRFPPKLREIVALRGQQYADAVSRHKQSLESKAASPMPLESLVAQAIQPPIVMDEKTRMVIALNEILMQRNLYSPAAFRNAELSKEAQRLLRIAPDDWTDEQVERLNRHLLEAAYPQDLRKIYVLGWRSVLMVYGLAGLAVAGMFWFVLRNRPAQHPWCNAAEVRLIEGRVPEASAASEAPAGVTPAAVAATPGKPPSPAAASRVRIPLKQILLSPTMWLTSLSQFGTNVGWVFLVTWLPRYLEEVHKAPIEMRGWMAAIPLGCGIGGMMLGGVLTDAMVRMCGLRWGRALPMGLTRFLASAAFLVCTLPLHDWCGTWTPWVVTAAFSTVAFATDLGVPAVWAFCQDVGGRHVGSVLGWGNMWGNIGAAISPLLLNELVSDANWDLAFGACAIAFLISGIAALGVDATRPIVPEEEPR